jgi:hypothetical protein
MSQESPVNKPPPGSPMQPLWTEMPISRVFFYISPGITKTRSPDKTKSHLFLMLPVKESPTMFPQWGPYRERCSVSRANGLFIHSYLSESPVKELFHKIGGNVQSPSMEPYMDGRPTYSGDWPGSTRVSVMTLLFLPQCHAAFSTVASTLAWVDQIPISQHVS